MTGEPHVNTCSGRLGNMGDHIKARPSDNNSPLRGVNDDDDDDWSILVVDRVPSITSVDAVDVGAAPEE